MDPVEAANTAVASGNVSGWIAVFLVVAMVGLLAGIGHQGVKALREVGPATREGMKDLATTLTEQSEKDRLAQRESAAAYYAECQRERESHTAATKEILLHDNEARKVIHERLTRIEDKVESLKRSG